MSMSLDGFVADANDGVGEVFDWYMTSGDVEFSTGGSDPMTFRVSPQSAEHLRALWTDAGLLDEMQIDVAAVLLGSGVRLFDHLTGMPAFLGDPKVVAGVGVTHLRYAVRKA